MFDQEERGAPAAAAVRIRKEERAVSALISKLMETITLPEGR